MQRLFTDLFGSKRPGLDHSARNIQGHILPIKHMTQASMHLAIIEGHLTTLSFTFSALERYSAISSGPYGVSCYPSSPKIKGEILFYQELKSVLKDVQEAYALIRKYTYTARQSYGFNFKLSQKLYSRINRSLRWMSRPASEPSSPESYLSINHTYSNLELLLMAKHELETLIKFFESVSYIM